jgi:RPA family protein
MRNDEWIIEKLEFLLQDMKAMKQQLNGMNLRFETYSGCLAEFRGGIKTIIENEKEICNSLVEMNLIIQNAHQQLLKSLNK